MRKFLKWVFILIVVVGVGGYFGIPALLGTGFAHEQVRQAMADGTGREVELGQISFGWMSGLTVSNVTVKQKAGDFAEEGPLFTLEGLSLDLGWKQILNKKIEVSDLTVDGPSIVIIRDKNGRFNFDDLLEKSAEEKPDTPSGTAPPVTVHLFINDGRVLFIDQKVGTRVEMEDFDARAEWKEARRV
jgi:AsmA protein